MQDGTVTAQHDPSVFRHRLWIGLTQGLLLFALLRLHGWKMWPATESLIYAPLVVITLLLPSLLVVSAGHIEWRRLLRLILPVALILALASGYADWRLGDADLPSTFESRYQGILSACYLAPLLFISWVLIQAAEQDKRWPADYTSYFELAWKLAIQHLFAAVFVAAFWLVIWLGVGLFMMLKLSFLRMLVTHDWFWLPATTLAVACGLHLSDVRPNIVSGIRNLLLSMLSWLLPLLAALVTAFLVAVPLAGFELLWSTRFATTLLLGTCVVLVVLINTAFQDGTRSEQMHRLLQHAARLAAVLLLPLALIAAYALNLRVAQYGWSPDRISAALAVAIALFYATGYLWVVIEPLLKRSNEWLPRITLVNTYASVLIVVLGVAMLTPVLDPARLSVKSQIAMLESGRTPATQFDFKFLRFDSVRYGREALAKLADSTDAVISDKARMAMALKTSMQYMAPPPAELAEQLILRTPGKIWPQGFLDTDWANHEQKWQLPICMRESQHRCDAYVGDFSGQGSGEVLLVPQDYGTAVLFSDSTGGWRAVSIFDIPGKCARLRDDLAVGKFAPVVPQGMDLLVGNIRLRAKSTQPERSKCE